MFPASYKGPSIDKEDTRVIAERTRDHSSVSHLRAGPGRSGRPPSKAGAASAAECAAFKGTIVGACPGRAALMRGPCAPDGLQAWRRRDRAEARVRTRWRHLSTSESQGFRLGLSAGDMLTEVLTGPCPESKQGPATVYPRRWAGGRLRRRPTTPVLRERLGNYTLRDEPHRW